MVSSRMRSFSMRATRAPRRRAIRCRQAARARADGPGRGREVNGGAALRQHPLAVALREALQQRRDVVLGAPTGAGKSTLVPLALLEEEFVAGRKILLLEPRRLAARAIAARMASLRGEQVGQSIG